MACTTYLPNLNQNASIQTDANIGKSLKPYTCNIVFKKFHSKQYKLIPKIFVLYRFK